MSKNLLIIRIRDGHVDAAVFHRGSWQRACAFPHECSLQSAEGLPTRIQQLEPLIASIAQELGAPGCDAVILLPPSMASAQISSTKLTGSDGEQALTLATLDMLDSSAGEGVTALRLLGNSGSGADRERVYLQTAMGSDGIDALWAALECAGLNPIGAVATSAGLLASAYTALDKLPASGAQLLFRIGDERSILMVSQGGVVKMSREIDLSIDRLVAGLRTPLDPKDPALSVEEARSELHAHGIQPSHEGSSELLSHAERMARLQPIIQRCTVEIRQTVRFTMGGANGEIHISGPGAALPGLADGIAREIGLPVQLAPSDGSDYQDLKDAVRGIGPGISVGKGLLVPRAVSTRASGRKLMTAALVGVAAAVAVGAVHTAALNRMAGEVHAQIAQMSVDASTEQIEQFNASTRATELLTGIDGTLKSSIGHTTPLGAALRSIARATPEGISIASISVHPSEKSLVASFSGFQSDAVPDAIERFIAQMESQGLADGIILDGTRATTMNGHVGKQFSMTITLRGYTSLAAHGAIADAGTGDH